MKKILLFSFLLLLVSSCVKLEKLSVNDIKIENISFKTMSNISLDLLLKVNNPNKKAVVLIDAELEAQMDETYLGLLEVMEKVTIPPSSHDYVRVPLELSVADLSALMNMRSNPESFLDKFDVTGFVKVKAGAITKKHKVAKTTLLDLLQNL